MSGRVLHVIATCARRGAEAFALELADALGERGWPGRVVAVEPGPQVDLDVPVLARRWPSPAALVRLRAAARRAEVVVAHGSTALPAVALAGGAPFVYRTIGDPAYWGRRWVGVALRRAAVVVALWPEARHELLRRYHLERVVVLPTAVDTRRFRPADDARRSACRAAFGIPVDACPVVAVVAALSPEKDVGLAVAAMHHLPDGFLLVAGDGPERVALEAAAPAGRARFLGNVADVGDVLAAADVLALTSRTEGVPAAVLEAAAAGVPVAATPVGAVPDMVVPGVNGALVAARTAEAVALAVTQAAPLRAQPLPLPHYGLDAVADGWADLLGSVVRHAR